jgi:hypothetical protein
VPGTAPPDPTVTRTLAALGLLGSGFAVVLVGLLHVVSARQVDPVRRTISEYALGHTGWMFDAGVLGLAAGSVLVLLALVRAALLPGRSAASVLLVAWSLGLVAVVAFEKANWSVGPTPGGYVHRFASLIAFSSLAVAALALGRRWRGDAQWGGFAAWSRWAGAFALMWLGAIVLAVALRPVTGVPASQLLPLGLVERVLAVTEVVVVVILARWAARAAAPAGREIGVVAA